MSNMSYCRFHNTVLDLRDCWNALIEQHEIVTEGEEEPYAGEDEFVSSSEARSRMELIRLVREMAEEFESMEESIEVWEMAANQ